VNSSQDKFEIASNFQQGIRDSRPRSATQILVSILSLALLYATCPQPLLAFQDAQSAPPQSGQAPAPARTPLTQDQLQQLVAPIALYPDSLVAQILAASTYPEQVVEADRWVQANPNLTGDDLAKAVDQQNWDPSVKALCAFPSVLANMDKNISWTSSLGDAYYNQAQDVMGAIQVMRKKAQQAGNLQSTPQQTVETQGSNVEIQPAEPNVVYVPAYNPWIVYGYPITPWPYWYPVPGIWFGGPSLFFGVGFGIGYWGGYGWGWGHWGFNWGNHVVVYNHNTYYSRSTTFYNRNAYYHGGQSPVYGPHGAPGPAYAHPGTPNKPFGGDTRAARGYDTAHNTGGNPGVYNKPAYNPSSTYRPPTGGGQTQHYNAFGDYHGGGQARSETFRGSSSMGGGGGFHGGGGGGHR
jgi:uncharacterized membrane protein YgcG